MYYALVYYPKIESSEFHNLRHKYEPFAGLLREHVPLIFPLPETIGLNILVSHINKILKNWSQFEIHFYGLEKTWDHWLILSAKEGNDLITKLHNELYSDLLKPYLREDLPFIPHIGLGFFSYEKYNFDIPEKSLPLDQIKYNQAKNEFENLNPDYWRTVSQLTLVKVNNDFTKCRNIRTFSLTQK